MKPRVIVNGEYYQHVLLCQQMLLVMKHIMSDNSVSSARTALRSYGPDSPDLNPTDSQQHVTLQCCMHDNDVAGVYYRTFDYDKYYNIATACPPHGLD